MRYGLSRFQRGVAGAGSISGRRVDRSGGVWKKKAAVGTCEDRKYAGIPPCTGNKCYICQTIAAFSGSAFSAPCGSGSRKSGGRRTEKGTIRRTGKTILRGQMMGEMKSARLPPPTVLRANPITSLKNH